MSDTDPDLDRLHDLLSSIPPEREGMNVGELDGYVAALIVCPDPIPPSEWLPGVWGEDHAFSNTAEAEATTGAVNKGRFKDAGTGAAGADDSIDNLVERDLIVGEGAGCAVDDDVDSFVSVVAGHD